jgi:hypothetical protein
VPDEGASQWTDTVRPVAATETDSGAKGTEQPDNGKVRVTLFDDPLVPDALVARTVNPKVPAGTKS